MIRHQTVAHDGKPVLLRVLAEQIQEQDAVGVAVKDVAPVVAALREMMRQFWNNNPSASWHLRYSLESCPNFSKFRRKGLLE